MMTDHDDDDDGDGDGDDDGDDDVDVDGDNDVDVDDSSDVDPNHEGDEKETRYVGLSKSANDAGPNELTFTIHNKRRLQTDASRHQQNTNPKTLNPKPFDDEHDDGSQWLTLAVIAKMIR